MKKMFLVFILICVLFSSCLDKKPTIIVHNATEVAEIPFEYSPIGHIVTRPVIKGDTLNFILDTGAYLSIISTNIDDDGYLGNRSLVDINHKKDTISICKLNLLQFTDVDFKHMVVGKTKIPYENVYGIIGRDILENFCIKIDNKNKRILLSQNPDLINKVGIEKQFNPSLNTIELVLDSDSTKKDFLFDTGNGIEVFVDSSMFSLQSIAEHPKTTWELPNYGLFQDRGKNALSKSYSFLSNLQLDTITFKNVVCEYNKSINQNMIGNAFISRFKSVVFDYINGKAFFELPDNKSIIGLSKNEVNNTSIFSLNMFFSRINSLGFIFSCNTHFIVSEIVKRDSYSAIEIGDTLIGINNVIFSEKIFNRKKKQYYLETDTIKQKKLLQKTLCQSKKATFLFLKNNEKIAIAANRENIFAVKPTLAYSFLYKNAISGYYAISFAVEKEKSLMIHLPYSTLSGEELEIFSYKNGKKTKLSNNPEKLDYANNHE